jgi:hypothetical protein
VDTLVLLATPETLASALLALRIGIGIYREIRELAELLASLDVIKATHMTTDLEINYASLVISLAKLAAGVVVLKIGSSA